MNKKPLMPRDISRYMRTHEKTSRIVGGYEYQPSATGMPATAAPAGSTAPALSTSASTPVRFAHPAGYPARMGAQPQMVSPQPTSGSQVNAASLPIVINVNNSTGVSLPVTLFGAAANQLLPSPSFGNNVGIQITSGNPAISYQQILSNTISTNFSCSTIRLVCSGTPNQVQQPWSITSVNMEGQSVSTPIPTTASFSPMQFQAGIIDLNYPLKIDGLTTVGFTLLANTLFTIYFYPGNIVAPVNELVNGSATRSYATPNIPTVYSSPMNG